MLKVCSKCNESKLEDLFSKKRSQCKMCRDLYHVEYRLKNKNKINDNMKVYYENNKEQIKKYKKKYRIKNKNIISEKYKNWKCINKEYIKSYIRKWQSDRLKKDPCFKLRRNVARLISFKISKNSKSSFKYLPYTVQDLKKHLESKFESWMTWDNWGKYQVDKWDDNNESTWTWQIDHIIPQSDLIYDSMDNHNFKKCWDLNNLRPYSAKNNLIDGVNKIRHIGGQTW